MGLGGDIVKIDAISVENELKELQRKFINHINSGGLRIHARPLMDEIARIEHELRFHGYDSYDIYRIKAEGASLADPKNEITEG
jgi:hypothetical protein